MTYRTGKLYSEDLPKLLEQKLRNDYSSGRDEKQAPFISTAMFQEGLGYVVIEAP